jgi:hypothetical protein
VPSYAECITADEQAAMEVKGRGGKLIVEFLLQTGVPGMRGDGQYCAWQ